MSFTADFFLQGDEDFKAFLKAYPFVETVPLEADSASSAFCLGQGEENVLFLCGCAEKKDCNSAILRLFLFRMAESVLHGEDLCGIRLADTLQTRKITVLPHLGQADMPSVQALCERESFRHAVLLSGADGCIFAPRKENAPWSAQMPMALKILSGSADYPLCYASETAGSFALWFQKTFHRPVFTLSPKIKDSLPQRTAVLEAYTALEETLLLASVL